MDGVLETRCRTMGALAPLILALLLPAGPRAEEEDPESTEKKRQEGIGYSIPAGERHEGDLYLFRPSVRIAGEQEGDVAAWTRSLTVSGVVDGDLFVVAQTVEISGTVRDSVRVFCQTVTVSGTIEGDLLAFAGTVNLLSGSRITRDATLGTGTATLQGTIGRDLGFTGGQVSLAGEVGGDARIKCDQIQVDSETRISGDLSYTARNRLDLEGTRMVGGDVDYEERKAKEKDKKPFLTTWRILKFLMLLASSFFVGLIGLKVLPRPAARAVATVGRTPLWSTGVGFIALIVTPVAAVILVVLILTIPVAVILGVLWLVGLYVAKLPVAAWIGDRILRAVGRPSPSAVWSLLLGLLILYPMFKIPCVGKLVWLGCAFLGLGAILLGAREPTSDTGSADVSGAAGRPPAGSSRS